MLMLMPDPNSTPEEIHLLKLVLDMKQTDMDFVKTLSDRELEKYTIDHFSARYLETVHILDYITSLPTDKVTEKISAVKEIVQGMQDRAVLTIKEAQAEINRRNSLN